MGAPVSKETRPEPISIKPAPETYKPPRPTRNFDESISDFVKCPDHRENVTYYSEESGDVFCDTCMRDPDVKANKAIVQIEEYVSSIKFQQMEILVKSQANKRKTKLEDELRRNANFKQRIGRKRKDFQTHIEEFEKDMQAILRRLCEDLGSRVDSDLDLMREKKQAWMDSLESELDNLTSLLGRNEVMKEKSSTFRLTAYRELQGLVKQSVALDAVKDDPEDYKIRFNADLKVKDIFGDRNTSKEISLGDFGKK